MTVAAMHHPHWWVESAVLLAIVLVIAVVTYRRSKRHSLHFDVVVGEDEQHMLSFFRNAWTGRLRISVDGVGVLNKLELFSWKLQKTYEVPVGEIEHHVVKFVKTRKRLGGESERSPSCPMLMGMSYLTFE
jgi:hypothetical protein